MSGKRARAYRAESSSSALSFDNSRFMSLVNFRRYEEIESRDFIRERGFLLRTGEYTEIQNRIRDLGWEVLCRPATKFAPEIVKEFYANAYSTGNEIDRENFSSFVREQTIFYTANTINNLFGLRYGPDGIRVYDEWMRYRYNRSDIILHTLCREGANWELNAQGKETHFKKSDMKQIPKAWCTFTQANLLPTSNRSEVTIERAVVIFLICRGYVFNVGSLISHNMEKLISTQGKRMGYPCLITNLCQREGVSTINEFLRDPEGPITSAVVDSMAPRDRAPADPPQAPSLIPQVPVRPRAAPVQPGPSITQQLVDMQTSLNNLWTSHNNFVATYHEDQRGLAEAMYTVGRSLGVDTSRWSLQDPSHDPYDDVDFDSTVNAAFDVSNPDEGDTGKRRR